jgi:hypothetical protein
MLPIWLRLSFVSFCLSVSVPLLGQAAQGTRSVMTNSDVAQMAKAGISESTILLAIQKSSTDFDTSAQSLVDLKKQGVSDKLLDAMLVRAEMSISRPVTGEPPIARGADVNFRTSQGPSQSALALAKQKGHKDVVEILKKAGARN